MTAIGYALVGGNGTTTGRVRSPEGELLPALASVTLRLAS